MTCAVNPDPAERRVGAADVEVVGVTTSRSGSLFDAELLVVADNRNERRAESGEDGARREDELHRAAAVFRASFGEIAAERKADVHRAAGIDRRLRRESEQGRAVLGLVLLAVHRPVDVGPVEAAGQGESLEGRVVGVRQREPSCSFEVAFRRVELERQVDVDDLGLPRVLPGREVLLPVVVGLLLGRVRLAALRDHHAERGAEHRREQRVRREAQGRAPQRPRAEAVDDPDRVGVATPVESHRDHHEERRQREHQQPVEHERRPVHLERAHVAPANRVPEIPVESPVHLVAPLGPSGRDQGEQSNPVGRVPVPRDRDHGGDETGPHQEGGNQEQRPGQEEGR